jgi:EAL domain-containing protein (putative c-di-GMP-specific phosphodiesterase class I)
VCAPTSKPIFAMRWPNESMDVYFQPLVNTRTRKVSGYETLLRWNRPWTWARFTSRLHLLC